MNGGENYHFCYVGSDARLGLLLKYRLEKAGIVAVTPDTPLNSFKLVHQLMPRVVLVDERIGMNRNSLDLILALRRTFPRERMAVLWHPQVATRDNVVSAIRTGVDSVIVRPLTMAMLIDRINSYLLPRQRSSLGEDIDIPENPSGDDVLARLGRVQSLSAVPFVVERIMKLTGNDESGARDLEQVIESDPQVTAIVLMRANSAFYASSRKIGRVIDAVARIGFREVRAIVLGLSVINMFSQEQKNVGFDRADFWKKSLVTAVLARMLAEETPDVDPDDAFIAGLLIDLGRIVLDEHFTSEFARAVAVADKYRVSLVEAERKILGIDHQGIGRNILERWRFPEQLVEVVGCHEEPEKMRFIRNEKTRALAETVWAAQWVSSMLPVGSSGEAVVHYPDPQFTQNLKFWKALKPGFADRAYSEVSDLLSFIGSSCSIPLPEARQGEDKGEVIVYEETELPVSPLQHIFEGGLFSVTKTSDLVQLGNADPHTIIAVEFKTVDAFLAAKPYLPDEGHPLLVVLPRGDVPKDETIRKRVGLPVRNTVYLEKPIHRSEFWDEIRKIIPTLAEPTA